jgi:long-subunit acyl-CoA synthetase (AMP-forming)
MLTDAKAKVMLTNKPIFSEFLKFTSRKEDLELQLQGRIVYLDEPLPHATRDGNVPSNNTNNPEDMAYIMYTSGSTGRDATSRTS